MKNLNFINLEYKPLPVSQGYGFFKILKPNEEAKEVLGLKPIVQGIYANYFYSQNRIFWPDTFPNRADKFWGHNTCGDSIFNTSTPYSHIIDGFSPNLNKDLHIGHLRNFCLALSLSRIFESRIKPVALLGLSLGEKPEALSSLLKFFSKFNYFPNIYFDTCLPPTTISFKEGEGEKAGCMVYGKDQVVMKRSDGTPTYPYHELCFAEHVNPTFYLTGAEQADHFKSLGLSNKHLPMGLILDLEGKKMKSRDGNSYKIEEAIRAISENLTDSKCSFETLSYNILFCNFLMTARETNLKFDPKLWSNPNSPGLYITYTYARLYSVLSKLTIQFSTYVEEKDIPLRASVAYSSYYFSLAVNKLDPVFIAQHTFNLCKEINAVYERERILDASESTIYSLKLASEVLEKLMYLLCMESPKSI